MFPRVFTEFDFTETGCHPLTVDLRSISKVYGSARYEWLVDGQSIGNTAELHPVLENPSHTTDKEFTVTLRATSEQGCTGEKEHKVIVWPKPLANFSFVGAALHCPPYDTRLDVSRSEGVNLTYSYDLGDGRQVENQETTGISHTLGLLVSSVQLPERTVRRSVRLRTSFVWLSTVIGKRLY